MGAGAVFFDPALRGTALKEPAGPIQSIAELELEDLRNAVSSGLLQPETAERLQPGTIPVRPTVAAEAPAISPVEERLTGLLGRTAAQREERLTALQESQARQREAVAAQAQAQAKRTGVLAQMGRDAADLQLGFAQEAEEKRAEFEGRVQEAQAEIAGLRDEFRAVGEPARGPGAAISTILGAIASGFGALGAGLAGGPNVAAQIVQRNIDRSIAERLRRQRDVTTLIKGKKEDIQSLRAGLQSDLKFLDFVRIAETDQMIKAGEALAAEHEGTALGQQLKATNEALAQQNLVNESKLAQSSVADELRGIGALAALQQARRRKAAPIEGLLGGEQATKDDIKKAKVIKSSFDEVDAKLAEMIDLRREFGAEVANREVVRRQKQLSTDVRLALKEINKLGVLSGSDLELLNNLIPEDPTEVGFVLNSLISARSDIRRRTRADLKTFGGFEHPTLEAEAAPGAVGPLQTSAVIPANPAR